MLDGSCEQRPLGPGQLLECLPGEVRQQPAPRHQQWEGGGGGGGAQLQHTGPLARPAHSLQLELHRHQEAAVTPYSELIFSSEQSTLNLALI